MGFLDGLGSSLLSNINSAFGFGDSGQTNINTDALGNISNYGALGNFAQKIDQSAQRQYLEDGLIVGVRPKNLEVFFQQPDITVLVKKRQFSSLAENYRYDLMNADEKLFIRASKRLFYNKCTAIAAYERLSKIEQVVINSGIINDFVFSQTFASLDALNTFAPGTVDSQTQAVFDTIRRVKNFSDPNPTTTWLIDQDIPYASDTGEGTGVIELTTVASMQCTNSVNFGGGSCSVTIEDPYKLFWIKEADIEQAIADASNIFNQNNFFRLTESNLADSISNLKNDLASFRAVRGASPIEFIVDPTSLLFKKVRAILDSDGSEFIFSYSGGLLGIGSSVDLDPSATVGANGLQGQEIAIFQQIISSTYTMMGYEQTTQSQKVDYNQQTNYVRKKMWLNYKNKQIIQPMDVIHIYISSKTMMDDKIAQNLNFTFAADQSPTANLNNKIGALNGAFDSLQSAFGQGSGSNFLQTEKDIVAGPDFPLWLWAMMRNSFTRQAAGTHVFAGVVEEVPSSNDNGVYTLNVSAKDQMAFMNFGQININPGVDVVDADLYDPMTPFNLSFDSASGFAQGTTPILLDENIRLLGSGSAKAKMGRFKGVALDQSIYQIQNAENPPGAQAANNIFRLKLNDPDGFVYRWKEGIGSLTADSPPHTLNTNKVNTAQKRLYDPFAGQDVMDVLSLLVTGQPYNFNNYVKGAIASNNFSKDDLTNQSGSSSFLQGLVNDISKQNQTWGNFMPFKKLVVNEAGYNFLASGQFDLSTANNQINSLLEQRAKKFDALTSVFPQFATNPQFYQNLPTTPPTLAPGIAGAVSIDSLQKLGQDLISLDTQIAAQQTDFTNTLQSPNIQSSSGSLTIFGNDISFDPSVTNLDPTSSATMNADRDQLRKELLYLTQRRLWQVKSNTDQNLFIVDDSYDKNYDIKGFEAGFNSNFGDIYKSTWSTVGEQLQSVGLLLGLEVFADSQGHIQARPPQYNRMPSSVYYKMLQNKDTLGIQVFPDYLQSLFLNQIDGLSDQIEINDDQIRIRCAALGATNDTDAAKLLNGSTVGNATGSLYFYFVTDALTGTLGGKDLRSLITSAYPDLQDAISELTGLANNLQSATTAAVNFDAVQRATVVNSSAIFQGVDAATNNAITSAIAQIGQRLSTKTQQPAPTLATLLSNDRSIAGKGRSQTDILNLTNQISNFIVERQNQIKLFVNAIKNLNQGLTLNLPSDPSKSVNLFPNLNAANTQTPPEIIAHMIEDENTDDYGPGSGRRYIITDSRIISQTFTEKAPEWTSVDVNGQLSKNEIPPVPGPDNSENRSGGNRLTSASAVDYDMWRMYGFRTHHPAKVPFLSDPDAQCAPYAVFLLNLARRDILQGNITCIGNEYMQCGEVYYIEDRDMLYYATSVSHSFNYAGTFTTSLTLKFGHNPGEYIPTVLDIIGKGLYSAKSSANSVRHVRNGNATGGTPMTNLTIDNNGTGDLPGLVAGVYGQQNSANLSNLMLAAAGLLAPTTSGDQFTMEIRVYYNSKQGFASPDGPLTNAANSVLSWIRNPSQYSSTSQSNNLVPSQTVSIATDPAKSFVLAVDLGSDTEIRSPSSGAWNMARTVVSASAIPTFVDSNGQVNNSQLLIQENKALFTNIIDIWITQVPASTGAINGSVSGTTATNQAAQQQQAQYTTAFNAYVASLKPVTSSDTTNQSTSGPNQSVAPPNQSTS